MYVDFFFFFQGRIGRKGFPGKVGPEGLKVEKSNILCCFLKKQNKTTTLKPTFLFVQKKQNKKDLTRNIFVPAGGAWSHRKYWTHGRKGKTPQHRRLLCSQMPAYSSLQHCVSVFQGLVGFIGPVGESGIPGEKVKRKAFSV